MNQNKQMREALQKVAALRGNVYESESKAEMQALIDAFMACEQALAAEPAPLVRLTTANIQTLRDAYAAKHMTFLRIHRGQCICMPEDLEGFALEVQTAVIAKNGGKP